ncbi:hypothetical protein [Bradyrhizobium valentinum]|nr:hypothetical protein [Bradyrhizobium valentinum]
MCAFVVAAEHMQPPRAGLPHLVEDDLLFALHAPSSAKNHTQPEYAIW